MSLKVYDWKMCYNFIVERDIVNSCYMHHSFKIHTKMNIWYLVTIFQSQTWVLFHFLHVLWTWTKYMCKCWPWCELELNMQRMFYLKNYHFLFIYFLWTCQHTDLSVRFLCMNYENGYVVSIHFNENDSGGAFRIDIHNWTKIWIDIQVLYHTDENASSSDTLALIYETTCITHHNKQSTYGNLKLKYVCFVLWVIIGSHLP
jgi:hypothetical protein